jgi:N-acetylated-alpha-linked acidic dipeptidase
MTAEGVDYLADLNVDESTNGGTLLGAIGSPLLADALCAVMRLVPSPVRSGSTVFDDSADNESMKHNTVHDATFLLSPVGTGSDYTSFFHHLGIPSLDLVFNKNGNAVYPYHSNYDSFFWIEKFGDPGFKKHLAMARLWGTLAVRLAGIPLLSFKAHDYALTLRKHVQQLEARQVPDLKLRSLEDAVAKFASATAFLDAIASGNEPVVSPSKIINCSQIGVAEINKRYKGLEKAFLLGQKDGLPGRPWYKHMVSPILSIHLILPSRTNYSWTIRSLLRAYGLATTVLLSQVFSKI